MDEAHRVRLLHLSGIIEGQSGSLGEGVKMLQQAARLSDDPSLTLGILRHAATMAGFAGDHDSVIRFGDRAPSFRAIPIATATS